MQGCSLMQIAFGCREASWYCSWVTVMIGAVQGTRAKILETRKTVPGLRVLDKWAVLAGGPDIIHLCEA